MTAPHGGDMEAVSREYGIPIAELIDFSASINPLGPPASVLARLQRESTDISLLSRYPDPRSSELRSALATRLDVSAQCLTIANGSAALVGAVVRAVGARTCLLPVPAFSEQPHALSAAGCAMTRFPLDGAHGFRLDTGALCHAIAQLKPTVCVLTNPHNPSGMLTTAVEMGMLVRAAVTSQVLLLVDEAFMDFAPTETLIAEATRVNQLVVLRSLTKFYGMPALRVGYCVSTPEMAEHINAQLPTWPVTALAASAAVEAVRDDQYAAETLCTVARDRQHFRDELARAEIESLPSAANFLLLRLPSRAPQSTRLRMHLIRSHGIVVRDCCSFDGMADGRFIRVAVRARADNMRLVDALRSAVRGDLDC